MDQNQMIDNEMSAMAASVVAQERIKAVTAALDQFESAVTEAELPEIIAQLDSLEFMTSLIIAKRLWRRFRDSLVKQPGWMEWFKKHYKAIYAINGVAIV